MSNDLKWAGGDHIALYNIAPGQCPWMIMLHDRRLDFIGHTWGYRTPEEAAAKKKPWISVTLSAFLGLFILSHKFNRLEYETFMLQG
ncbi:hypothetical protein [Nitrosovibrio sp. Nv6]|uniref:hypothetical protein n=1 Tax=Nitrosovibrio sp. Nv6 TaxID=1855340 RepID=UPI0008CE624A|nr:hypothetical protein [Nitrosovibrio sp. Nv6]SEP38473.1 hypothetical protein SAMN05216316_2711 [Nitrosovibrio sp. Nv6]